MMLLRGFFGMQPYRNKKFFNLTRIVLLVQKMWVHWETEVVPADFPFPCPSWSATLWEFCWVVTLPRKLSSGNSVYAGG